MPPRGAFCATARNEAARDRNEPDVEDQPTVGIRTTRKVNRRKSAAKRQIMARDYRVGLTINEVAARHGVNRDTVMRALRIGGVESRRFRLDEQSIQEIVDLRHQGLALSEIAERLGVDRHTLSRNLKRLGYEDLVVRRQSVPDAQVTEAVRLYVEGSPVSLVSQSLGLSRGVVGRAIVRAGVVPVASQ
jgi:transposase-like protein